MDWRRWINLCPTTGRIKMRAAIVVAMSVLAATAACAEPRDQQTPHITMLKVHVLKDPVITADMMSPKLTLPQKPVESAIASR
jgi:hypothetical protein